ncbi:MAG TPA: hypothetical protein DDW87_10070 [Firmicutes bacterium]|nr:hypothetical protein [Bacillota bacterium]
MLVDLEELRWTYKLIIHRLEDFRSFMSAIVKRIVTTQSRGQTPKKDGSAGTVLFRAFQR